MEKLTRGVVSVPTASGTGRFISWRFLGTDHPNTTFDVLCDGVVVKSDISDKTNFVHTTGSAGKKYQIVTKVNGEIVETSDEAMVFDDIYKQLPLDKPADGTNIKGYTYSYTPNDCSVGDVDGDGEYEIILKWDPSNSQDNGHADSGSDEWTGNVLLDCYKLDGTKLWRIDLGNNIRAGAHYTQFLVYDFDGDGKAELICKTAPGSIDGQGEYVNQAATNATIKAHNNTAQYYNASGHVLSGPEYLTVFNGETGKAVHTIWYNPNRSGTYNKVGAHPSDKNFWGDNYGNRCERYLACVAHLDGADKNASAVMVRGYYTRAYLWAVDFDGSELKTKWLHASVSGTKAEHYDADWNMTSKVYTTNTRGGTGSKTMYGNGNHNISVADVDGDGCDEILFGSAALNNDGKLLYATGFGHGDAIHVSDLVPSRPGLEVFQVHEDSPYGWDLHDAATGEILYSATSSGDNGRGLAADIDATNPGAEFCSASDRQIRSATTGEVISTKNTSVNFRAYWDGDLQEELLDGNQMDKWNGNGTSRIYPKSGKNFYDIANSSTCNSTKKTPNLLADILGDWREELILWDGSTGAA
ncbi:MAG: rhamnogalacturonan lyase, partial [Prevotella sp.]|nr:rhamnogalacturonan lyase [Prevotella sp.]